MIPIHIVDRLTSTDKAIRGGMKEISRTQIADLIKEARDRIHELEGLAYSYHPQPDSPNGTTWRKEYEDLIEVLLTMTAKEFEQWQTDMKD
jgi:predicted RND superfamily exporter protein